MTRPWLSLMLRTFHAKLAGKRRQSKMPHQEDLADVDRRRQGWLVALINGALALRSPGFRPARDPGKESEE